MEQISEEFKKRLNDIMPIEQINYPDSREVVIYSRHFSTVYYRVFESEDEFLSRYLKLAIDAVQTHIIGHTTTIKTYQQRLQESKDKLEQLQRYVIQE